VTTLDEPGASLIRALATELAWFCRRRKDASGPGHLGVSWFGMCDFSADPRMPRGCSERCARVRAVLQLAAERLGCDAAAFDAPAPKRRAGQRSLDGL
jgi:hypothetical protein